MADNKEAARYDLSPSVEVVIVETKEMDGEWVKFSDHAASLSELRAEVERLRVDAERYRWIEDNATSYGGGNGFTLQVFVPHDMEDWGCAIDAARSAGRSEG